MDDANEFIHAVCDQVGTHLEELSLTTGPTYRLLKTFDSLRGFKSLTALKLSSSLLLDDLGPLPEQVPGEPTEFSWPTAKLLVDSSAFSRLRKLLPASLVELALYLDCGEDIHGCFVDILDDLLTNIKDDLPELKRLKLRYPHRIDGAEMRGKIGELKDSSFLLVLQQDVMHQPPVSLEDLEMVFS